MTISTSPIGPLLYLIFALIDPLTLAPVAGAEYPNSLTSVGEPHGHDAAVHWSEAEESVFVLCAVSNVSGDDSIRVEKSPLGKEAGDPVLFTILLFLCAIPFESAFGHGTSKGRVWLFLHISIRESRSAAHSNVLLSRA